MVQLRDFKADTPINGKVIKFESNKGELKYNAFTTVTWHSINGLAFTILKIDEISDEYYVTAYAEEDTISRATFNLRAFKDNENSDNYTQYPHRRISYPNGNEIPGDGLSNTDPADSNIIKKDVFIEVDMCNKFINKIFKEQFKNYLQQILERAKLPNGSFDSSGFKVHVYDIEVINEEMPESLTFREMRAFLANYRNYNHAIHVILGTRKRSDTYPSNLPGSSVLGYIIDYYEYLKAPTSIGGMGWSEGKAFHYAEYYSSGEHKDAYLDSVGCWVFVSTIDSSLWDTTQLTGTAALVAAHEIGHALGMQDDSAYIWGKKHLMVSNLPIDTSTFYWNDYAFFVLQSLQDCDGNIYDSTHYSICTTDILGIHNVACALKILPEKLWGTKYRKQGGYYGKTYYNIRDSYRRREK